MAERKGSEQSKGSVELTAQWARFLNLLATDEEFRFNVEQNPRETLAEFEPGVLKEHLDQLPDKVTLPSMEEIREWYPDLMEIFFKEGALGTLMWDRMCTRLGLAPKPASD